MPELPGYWSLAPIPALLGMVVFIFYALSSSKLYTRSQHLEIVSLHKTRGDEWKETSGKWEAVANEAMSQLALIAPELKIVGDFFTKVPVAPNKGHTEEDEGHPDVR